MFATKLVVNMGKLFFVIAFIPAIVSYHLFNNNTCHSDILERQINGIPEETLIPPQQTATIFLHQNQILKNENDQLKNICLFLIISFILCLLILIVYHHHRKLQLENNKLAERVKHTTWGFSVTQEFIRQNHIAFHQLIKILNQEKLTGNISTKVYNQLYQTLIKQNADYSGNLMNRLTNLDGAFAQKFQERFPNFNTDEILMATMIHHKWKLSHMATIFQTTLEAIRKRKTRLLNRISDKIEQDIDPEEYLIQL